MIRTTVLLPDDMYKELKEIAGAQSDFSKQLRAAVAHWINLKRKKGKAKVHNELALGDQVTMEESK